MASASHRQGQILVLSEFKRARYVGGTRAANDQSRMPVKGSVEDQARRVIVRRFRCDYVPTDLGNKFSNCRRVGRSAFLPVGEHLLRPGKRFKRVSAKGRGSERSLLDELSSSREGHIQ